MGRATSLNAHQTTRQRLKELEQLFARDRTIEDNCAVSSDTVNLENVLTKIQSYCRNFHGGAPFLVDENICTVPHSATVGCRRHPLHPRLDALTRLQRKCDLGPGEIDTRERPDW